MRERELAEQLVRDRVLSTAQVRQAISAQQAGGGRLDTVLLEMGFIGESPLLEALGRFHRTRTATALDLAGATPDVARLISPRVAKRYELVPFRLDGKKLSVASLNPGDLLVEDEIALLTGCLVVSYTALEVRVYEALARLYHIDRSPRLVSVSMRLASGSIPSRPGPPPAAEPAVPPAPVTPPSPLLPEAELPAEDGLEGPPAPPPSPVSSPPAPPAPPVEAAPEVPAIPSPPSPPPPPPASPVEPEVLPSPPPVPPSPAPTPPSPPKAVVTELEISDEEMALFPSLREGVEAEQTPEPEEAAVPEVLPPAAEPAPEPELPAPPEVPPAQVSEAGEVAIESIEEAAAAPVLELDPELRLAAASVELLNAEMREDIADSLLAFCAPYLQRRALFILRKDQVIGWRGEGAGIEAEAVRAITIPASEPSLFLGLVQGAGFWLSSIPPMPHNKELVQGLGGTAPPECVVLPVVVKSKSVCFLYGDNGDEKLGDLPMTQLRRLVNKAGVAFQVYILKSKIRTI